MVIFRCDASPKIGFGHLSRCRAMAQALRQGGESCVMFGPGKLYATENDQNIFSDWIARPWTRSTDDAQDLVRFASRVCANWIVLDDYRIDEPYQLALREAGLRWLQFDGTAKKPLWADLVLVPNLAVSVDDYAGMIRNSNARILAGSRYALLRPEFPPSGLRPLKRSVEQVLITFGGGDDRGAIKFVLSSLFPAARQDIRFLVLSGAPNPRNQEIADWIALHAAERVRLVVNPDDVASVVACCDLAIMAGGTSTYEAACCGLPMILISIADNQTTQSVAWEQLGAAIYLGVFPGISSDLLTDTFLNILHDGDRRHRMAHAGQTKVDGQGAQRIAEVLLTS